MRAAFVSILLSLALALMLGGCASRPPAATTEVSPTENAAGQTLIVLPPADVPAYMEHLRAVLAQSGYMPASAPEQALKLLLDGAADFEPDSGELRPAALEFYARLAEILRDYNATVIQVCGSADAADVAESALGLPARRADSIAAYLQTQGISGARLRWDDRGSAPAPRIELLIRPLVAGQEEKAWMPLATASSAGAPAVLAGTDK